MGANAALFLDLDGTLFDFALRPGDVVVAPGLRQSLARLSSRLHGALALVSGRPLTEIDALIGSGHAAAGVHGAQLRHADGSIECAAITPSDLDSVRALTATIAARTPGVIIEDKSDAIALHYRGAPHAQDALERSALALLAVAGSGFALQHGNHVIEIKPADCDKGIAVGQLMQRVPFAGRTPWMIGDDLTDEHAFERVNVLGGISVIVGSRRPTAAQYAFRAPDSARRWLEREAAIDDSNREDHA